MYNPYNPYGYLFPNQQQSYQPYQQQNTSIPQQQQTTQNGMPTVLQVPNIKQVEQAPVQAGGKTLVLVANEPVIAMRTADNMGITSTDYYHIEKFDPESTSTPSNTEYVTREEFNQFVRNLTAKSEEKSEEMK